MVKILVVVHQHRPEAAKLAVDEVDWLRACGHQVELPGADAVLIGRPELGQHNIAGQGYDLALSIGGDGTMLRTVELVAADDVPVLGVNAGQLGYLVELEPEGLRAAINRVLAGEFLVEERMRLEVHHQGMALPVSALNELVLEKTPSGHTVRLAVIVDGRYFLTFAADGLIVATPTGSTAYALSARAPVVAPTHRLMVLTPVAPHMLFDRSLVFEPTSELRLEVCSWRPAELFVDGRSLGVLHDGEGVTCKASPHPARLITFEHRDFLGILKAKFGLNDR
ncbi:MAG: NAD(+)/NADH kinase [Acidimicrobiales bacterium]